MIVGSGKLTHQGDTCLAPFTEDDLVGTSGYVVSDMVHCRCALALTKGIKYCKSLCNIVLGISNRVQDGKNFEVIYSKMYMGRLPKSSEG